jgi:hypothetical protein
MLNPNNTPHLHLAKQPDAVTKQPGGTRVGDGPSSFQPFASLSSTGVKAAWAPSAL